MTTESCISRRRLLQVGSAAMLAGAFVPLVRAASATTFRIGFVSPASGPLTIFSEPDQFVMAQVKRTLGSGISVNGRQYPVEIIYRDSGSSETGAAAAARELIRDYGVDLMVASSTPATTNPVADVCEAIGVPCLTNDTPWQAHFFGRGGDPAVGFRWTYHFFWGVEDVVAAYTSLWNQVQTNRRVGSLWPDDPDGLAWASQHGFPPALHQQNFELFDAGRFRSGQTDFVDIVSRFQQNDVEIVTGVIPPPDFARFWHEARRQGFNPKVVTVAKASEFPMALQPFGSDANGLSVEVSWSPSHPYHSALTGQSSAGLASEYTRFSGRNWTIPLGFKHALFEVAIDALRRSQGPGNPEGIRQALATTDYHSIVGPVNFQLGPVPNVSKTPLVCGQWEYRYRNLELLIVENSLARDIPLQARLRSMTG
ncbi:ABC transporter substrate-binding protein [Oceanobacter mangrovi]|uniref:ABC transporter substrate-binding protein n=1 Tax=Oceanobacter mangrovi TaxID=2862510 RepID=UPI001C8E397B|nr:ABC transporter substrate-binding protein [Oceanobacter mangrovi]